jgi:glucose-1-phosphate thymidylyltransferase
MKGIILAGGNGTRLRPLTSVTNKHLLPIYDKPMIFYPLQTLKSAGITDILIITGTEHAGNIFKLMGSGKDFGVKFTYRVQDTAGGLPHAIALAEDFVGNDKFISINGDNILSEGIAEHARKFAEGKEESRILLYETTTEEARKAGVAVFGAGEKLTGFVEKPQNPPSNWVVIGVYMYTKDVFNVIRTLKPSARGELEITDLHNHYLKRSTLEASKISGEWLDAGTFDELARANEVVQQWSISKQMR